MLAEREKRVRPMRDEKVLTSWNGLMIAALAEGYAATGELRYRAAAEKAVSFVKRRLMRPEGRLMRSFHAGLTSVPGFLEDYAFFVHGLIRLYEATLLKEHLDDALRLSREMLRLFGDEASGGLFRYRDRCGRSSRQGRRCFRWRHPVRQLRCGSESRQAWPDRR